MKFVEGISIEKLALDVYASGYGSVIFHFILVNFLELNFIPSPPFHRPCITTFRELLSSAEVRIFVCFKLVIMMLLYVTDAVVNR